MKFRVLIIPGLIDGSLNLLGEMMRLANMGASSDHISVEIVPLERCAEIDLVHMLRVQGKRFDCLHLLGHSDGQTFALASGDILDEDKVLALCRDAGAKVLFLNACSGASLCQYAANTTVAVALAWVKEVVDGDAIVATLRFYGYLAEHGDPWGSGLRRAYEAVGEKRYLLWLTDGEYVSQVIAPIIARLDRFDAERKEAFTLFSGRLDTIVDALGSVGNQMVVGLGKLTNSYSKIRILLYAIAVLIVILSLALGYVYAASAQTIPPTATLLPGCGSSGSQPDKCNTPTPTPDPPTPTFVSTLPPNPTEQPPTDTPEPEPPTPTDTPRPTNTDAPEPTSTPTESYKPASTKTPKPTFTSTLSPTVSLPTVTPTPVETIPPC